MKFSAKTRKETIEKLKEDPLDLLIIGGGITGAGLALQAGAKEMKAGLIEMQDFAAGTSSRSTKLVHGGLRYLKQFEVEMVAAIGREREVISQIAPHIVRPEKMLLPVYDEPGASFTEFSADVALDLYDRLAKVDKQYAYQFISKEEVLEEVPLLKEENLINGGFYLDYVNDDARLTIEIIKKAHEFDILLANYVKVVGFIYNDSNHIVGVEAEDILTGEQFEILATVVVNATGPWSDDIRNLQKHEEQERMYPTKGVHFVVDKEKLPVNYTIYTDTGLEDNRMIFIIPRGNKTYFGTTDTPYDGDLVEPLITKEDVDYLLEAIHMRFPEARLTLEDIETGWAGLRPLLLKEDAKDPSAISRGHDVFVSEAGLITIAGGKLTDYRLMAEDTFMTIEDELKMKVERIYPERNTRKIALSGGDLPDEMGMDEYIESKVQDGVRIGLTVEQAEKLIQWYGTNVETLFELNDERVGGTIPLDLELSLLYALEYESVISPVDFFLRRTDYLLFNFEAMATAKEFVLEYMMNYLDWSIDEKKKWENELERTIAQIHMESIR